jgi:hypothetical protein
MIRTLDDIPMLANDEWWFSRIDAQDFALSDRRQDQAKHHFFAAEKLYMLANGDGVTKYAVMCGHIEDAGVPFTVFFVVRDPYRNDAHVTDIRRMVTGDPESAQREFELFATSTMFSLFDL